MIHPPKALLLLLFLCIFRPAEGQNPTVQVEHFSIEQGLSHRFVNHIAKDGQGFIWVGTDNGLNRFDGYDFLNYDNRPRNRHKLRYNRIHFILPDRKGRLLLNYEESRTEMDLLDPLSGQVTPVHFGKEKGQVGEPRIIDGNIYFPLLQNGTAKIFQFDEESLSFKSIFEGVLPQMQPQCHCSFLKAKDGSFWFATYCELQNFPHIVHMQANGTLIRNYTAQDFPFRHNPVRSEDFIELTESAGGEIWLTLSRYGVYVLPENGPCKQLDLLPPGPFLFSADKKGNLLAFPNQPHNTALGCHLITPGRQVIDYSWIFDHQNPVNLVFSDDFTEGLLSASGDGFYNYQLRPDRFMNFLNQELGNVPYGISIRGMAKSGRDRLFIATERNGLYEMDLKSGKLEQPGNKSPELRRLSQLLYTRNLLTQGDSVLWISGLKGVLKYDLLRNSLSMYKTHSDTVESLSTEVWGMDFDKNGRLWVVRRDGKLVNIDPVSAALDIYRNKDGTQPLDASEPTFLLCGRDGALWLGTAVKGLIRIDPEKGESRAYTAAPDDPAGFNSNHITFIREDDAGLLWVGTMEGGLHVFDPVKGRVEAIYSRENGLLNNSVVGILPDDKGNYWVSTFIGLSYLDTKLKTCRNYTTADGLSHNEFNRYASLYDADYGRYYFGGMNGVNVFDRKAVASGVADPPLLVSELSIFLQNDQSIIRYEGIVDGQTVTLPPGTLSLQLRLSLATDHNAGANQFSYLIEGHDKDWNYLGSNHNLKIDHLPPGTYLLHLRGADSRGDWSRREITLQLEVEEFWYRRWWAWLLYVTLFTAGVYYIYRFQLRRRLAEKEAQRLQQLDAFKTRFFTNISHEFRTPLTVILGMVESLKKHFEQSAKPAHDQAAELVRRNSQRLLDLVNQLLDLSRLEAGKLNLSPANGDLVAMLQYHLESFHSYAQMQHVTLHFQSDRPHLEMAFDHEKVQTIFVNLISNALKFTREGGRVDMELQSGTAPEPEQITVLLRDTGIGIPAGQIERIFDRFYQVDDAQHGHEGTGIGLALVHELVKLMRGSISVSSTPGAGTTFRVQFPYTPPQTDLQTSEVLTAVPDLPVAPENNAENEQDQRPLLLLVEDNPDVRFYIAECVRSEYRVALAADGAEGIEKALELVPDIIISDVMMPRKDGFELCETLKNDERSSHIPIVLLTARVDFESRIAGLRRGADDYLAKPFLPAELQVRLDNLVQQRRRLQQRYAGLLPLSQPDADPELVLEDAFLLKIRNIVEAQISDSTFDMPQLERALSMSRSQVFRKVKALTGASPSVLIRNIRLQKAKELLHDDSLTIAEVAYEVGFSTPAYFSTMFLEAFGKTPGEWRKG